GDLPTRRRKCRSSVTALGEAAADARGARLLAGTVVAVQRAGLHGLVDPRDEVAMLVIDLRGVALADRGFQAPEPGLHLRSTAPILEALALPPMNPVFLWGDV